MVNFCSRIKAQGYIVYFKVLGGFYDYYQKSFFSRFRNSFWQGRGPLIFLIIEIFQSGSSRPQSCQTKLDCSRGLEKACKPVLSVSTYSSKQKKKNKTEKQTKNAETQKWKKQASKVLLCNKLYYNLFTSLQVRSYLS